jgi:hypothetical protein
MYFFEFIRKPLGLDPDLWNPVPKQTVEDKYFNKEQACQYNIYWFSIFYKNSQICSKNSYSNTLSHLEVDDHTKDEDCRHQVHQIGQILSKK